MQLNEATIEKLEAFIATSVVHRNECISPLPANKTWFQLTSNEEFPNKVNENCVADNDENFELKTIESRAGDIKTEQIEKKTRNPSRIAVKIKRIIQTNSKDIAADFTKMAKAKRRNRKTIEIAGSRIKNRIKKKKTFEIDEEIQTNINENKKRIKKVKKVKRETENSETEAVKFKKRNRGTKGIAIDEVKFERVKKRKRNRCQMCGKKQSSTDERKTCICRHCVKMQKRMMHVDNVKMKWDKTIKDGRCRRCEMKRNKITDAVTSANAPVYTATLNTFYNLCASLALSPKKPSWNGRVLL